jgi:hypothetical protein
MKSILLFLSIMVFALPTGRLAAQVPAENPPLQIESKMSITFWTKDLDRSSKWFQQVLGATVSRALPRMGYTELATPLSSVLIVLVRGERPAGARIVPTFHVSNLDDSVA